MDVILHMYEGDVDKVDVFADPTGERIWIFLFEILLKNNDHILDEADIATWHDLQEMVDVPFSLDESDGHWVNDNVFLFGSNEILIRDEEDNGLHVFRGVGVSTVTFHQTDVPYEFAPTVNEPQE